MFRRLLLMFFLNVFVFYIPVFAQVGDTIMRKGADPFTVKDKGRFTVTGEVRDSITGDPVPYATVFFPKSPVGTISDNNGHFVLKFNKLPGDSLMVNLMGYKTVMAKIDPAHLDIPIIVMLVAGGNVMNEVVISAKGEDPAITLMKKVIVNRVNNDPDKADNYGYEAYTKIEVDILHLSKEAFEKLPLPYIRKLSFIYNNLDTTSEKEPFLPFFLIETLSDYYYQRKPVKSREFIKANLIRGIRNPSITQYMGKMHLAINPYDNYISFFDKQFISPIGNPALSYYKYTILDTQRIYGYNVIHVKFTPKIKGNNCFSGTLKIVDSVFALQYADMALPNEANVNWIKDARFYKEYEPLGDSLWFCTKENITAELLQVIDFAKLPTIIARKTTSYKDIRINDSIVDSVINDPQYKIDVIVSDSARDKPDEFWAEARHDTLSKNEKSIYGMFDTLENSKTYKRFRKTAIFLASGVKQFGPIEVGPYWGLYTNNAIEGNRFRLSVGTTPKLFKNVYFFGYLAYGTKDERFKYYGTAFWLLDRQPRTYLNFSYKSDLDYGIKYYEQAIHNNVFSLAFRKPDIPLKLVFTHEAVAEFYKSYSNGFSHQVSISNTNYVPYKPLPSTSIYTDEAGMPTDKITDTKLDLMVRYAYKEHFLEGNYYRISLGSKYPVPEFHYERGIKNLLNGGYNYSKIYFSLSDDIRIPKVGLIYLNVFTGKYFGKLPYNLLELHPGNENYYYNKYTFNLMNQFEYLSDEFAGFNMEHSIGGGIFKYIPLIKKLKFRQFWTARGLIGRLNAENSALNMGRGYEFKTLEGNPYLEVGTGVENIFKVFRIDFLWRVLPTPLPTERKQRYFGIFGSLKLDF